ncbi:MAG: glycosyltransferase family 4 protein [Gammaproteobacteria bacterium]
MAIFSGRCRKSRQEVYGPVDDIFADLAAAHLHVISSLSEGCPTSILEAMATGLPSVGFADCPGTNQLGVDRPLSVESTS